MFSRLKTYQSAFSKTRFFSSASSKEHLERLQKQGRSEMQRLYPHVMEREFNNTIVYTLNSCPPNEMKKMGGLQVKDQLLQLSSIKEGPNSGSICFSLMPEIALIFYRERLEKKKSYLYAFPLSGKFLLPWSRWAEVISPWGFVLPSIWAGREILGMEKNKVLLEPMMGENVNELISQKKNDTSFKAFSNSDGIFRPVELFTAEDYPAEFDIKFTKEAKALVNQADLHYKEVNNNIYTRRTC